MQMTFKLARETKGAGLYQEKLADGTYAQSPNADGAAIGALYLRKSAFPAGLPQEFNLTLEVKS